MKSLQVFFERFSPISFTWILIITITHLIPACILHITLRRSVGKFFILSGKIR